ncbi:MAG: hypothetical protein AAAB35_23035 [Phyllobacterium sp.]|uniref:hypothetical protein n=1 Tax=Phyllobacterium sp. TaxID=1871046 RepID=UPI0030F19A89
MTQTAEEKETKRKAHNAEKMRKWREKNPASSELKAKAAERARQWRKANRERYRAQQNAWYAKNREKVAATNRKREQRRMKATEQAPAAVHSDE